MIRLLNSMMNGLADLVLGPLAGLSPWVVLAVASALASLLLVGMFRLTADQSALRQARNRFVARTLELLLFRHDLRVSLTACGRILATNLGYLRPFVLPILVSTIPLLLILAQLHAWFASRPLKSGEAAVLNVTMDGSKPVLETPVEVSAPESVVVETEGVRIPSRNEISWRLRATGEGPGSISIRTADATETKSVATGSRLMRVSNLRPTGFWQSVLHPSEPALSASGPIRSIELQHPARQLYLGEHEIDWLVAAIVLMMVFGLLLGRVLGVRIA